MMSAVRKALGSCGNLCARALVGFEEAVVGYQVLQRNQGCKQISIAHGDISKKRRGVMTYMQRHFVRTYRGLVGEASARFAHSLEFFILRRRKLLNQRRSNLTSRLPSLLVINCK